MAIWVLPYYHSKGELLSVESQWAAGAILTPLEWKRKARTKTTFLDTVEHISTLQSCVEVNNLSTYWFWNSYTDSQFLKRPVRRKISTCSRFYFIQKYKLKKNQNHHETRFSTKQVKNAKTMGRKTNLRNIAFYCSFKRTIKTNANVMLLNWEQSNFRSW